MSPVSPLSSASSALSRPSPTSAVSTANVFHSTDIAAGEQNFDSQVIAEKDIAGPSRLALPFHQEAADAKLRGSSPRTAQRQRKTPARLISPLQSAVKSKSSLQVKDAGSRSVPSSPMFQSRFGKANEEAAEDEREQLRDSLRGAPRRRPSVPFGLRGAKLPTLSIPKKGNRLSTEGPPPIWQDPSEHILSGNGSSLQHARSVYASGPVEVLPGLFLGDEFNARDDACLARLGITTILNVAKETTLPFQSDEASEQLDLLSSASLSRGMQNISIGEALATPTSSMPEPPKTAEREAFFTPLTSMHSSFKPSLPSHSSNPALEPRKFIYLRNTTSTPNLHSPYEAVAGHGNEPLSSSQKSNDSTPPSPSIVLPSLDSLSRYSPANLTITTPSSKSDQTSATSTTSPFTNLSITLPPNAIALNVLASPHTGRPQGLRYIKLPWTHDETDLAGAGAGGFVTGCSIIADTLGIDLTSGQIDTTKARKESVLVHCQCGVSRSATLVIAFVMQAAAYNYNFQETLKLTGMHDCYELVKELSSSISPNCSLIYQLVEWERYLSKQVTSAAQMDSHPSALSPEKKWGNEAMNEEDWTRMRMDEERKEREEEERSREERLKDARQSPAIPSPLIQSSPSAGGIGGTGIGARRKRPTPSLTLASSAKTTADQAVKEQQRNSTVMQHDDNETLNDKRALLAPPPAVRLSVQPGRSLRDSVISPALVTTSSNNSSTHSGTSTLLAGTSPMLSGSFGVIGQSAAERRSKHKRTFSSELPSWSRPSSIVMTTTVEDEDAAMVV